MFLSQHENFSDCEYNVSVLETERDTDGEKELTTSTARKNKIKMKKSESCDGTPTEFAP